MATTINSIRKTNLIALVALNGVVAKETKDYLDRIKKKEID